jgi:hypothetical protein
MEKVLEVHDDWCDSELFDLIEDYTLGKAMLEYRYVHDITVPYGDESREYRPGFSSNIFPGKIGQEAERITSQIVTRFCKYRNIKLKQLFATRSFIHLPNGKESKKDFIHTDNEYPHYVILYYIADSEGDTYLFEDDEKTIIKQVTPKKGRLVFFDGSIKHCSSTPTNTTRAILNFNIQCDI